MKGAAVTHPQVALVGTDICRYDSWEEAVEHCCTALGCNRDAMWFRYARGGMALFDTTLPWPARSRPIARILNPEEYQAAKSRGDLENEAAADLYFRRAGGSTPARQSHDQAAMTTTPTKPKAKPQEFLSFAVLQPIRFGPQDYEAGDTLTTAFYRLSNLLKELLAEGKIQKIEPVKTPTTETFLALDEERREATKPTRDAYLVLKPIQWRDTTREPGEAIVFASKGSHVNRDRWLKAGKIRRVEPASGDPVTTPAVAAPAGSQNELPPVVYVKMTAAEMKEIGEKSATGVLNNGGKKAPAVRPFEIGGELYVHVGSCSSSPHGHFYIKACPLLRPDQIERKLVPKVRNSTCGRRFYYGHPVTVRGKEYMLGPQSLEIIRSDCRCGDCAKFAQEAAEVAPPEAVPPTQTLKDLLGVNVGDLLRSRPYGDRWKIRTWRHNSEEGVLLSIEAEEKVVRGGLLGRDGRPVKNCVRREEVIIAEGGMGEIFEVIGAKKAKSTPEPEPQTSAVKPPAERFELVPCQRIVPSAWNPRKDFTSAGAQGDLAGLAQSIREQGIIEPLIVRPADSLFPDGPHTSETVIYELVAGERRWRAAKLAGLEQVPCIVRQLDELAAIRQQAVENLQRRDINPLEEAEGYSLLMRKGQYSVADICRETGKSEAAVYARLKLLDAPPGIRTALQEGRIPASTAELVARIEDGDFKFRAMDAILFPEHGEADEGETVLSFRQAKQWIESQREIQAREADWKKRAKESHLHKEAAQVLTAAQSDKVLLTGGYVKDGQTWVKPTDVCAADPQGRTFAALAKEAGATLPPPTIARDPSGGAPVVLLPRQEAERALGDLVPSIEEQEGCRAEEKARRAAAQRHAEQQRIAATFEKGKRAEGVLLRVERATWSEDLDETFLRLLVGGVFRKLLADDPAELIEALHHRNVPVGEQDEIDAAWCEEYLAGCGCARLRAWLVYFHLRDLDSFGEGLGAAIDEDRLFEAEAVFAVGQLAEVRG